MGGQRAAREWDSRLQVIVPASGKIEHSGGTESRYSMDAKLRAKQVLGVVVLLIGVAFSLVLLRTLVFDHNPIQWNASELGRSLFNILAWLLLIATAAYLVHSGLRMMKPKLIKPFRLGLGKMIVGSFVLWLQFGTHYHFLGPAVENPNPTEAVSGIVIAVALSLFSVYLIFLGVYQGFVRPECQPDGNALQPSVLVSQAPEQTVSSVPQVRPWVRYWARMFDVNLFALVVGLLLAILFRPVHEVLATLGLGILIFFLWIFLESLLLSWFGTTPGKSLFKTRLVLADNLSVPYSAALIRSSKVWWRGLGAGIPVVSFFTLLNAQDALTKDFITSWDREGGFVVVHEKIGIPRWIGGVMFDVVFLLLSIIGIIGALTAS